MATGTGAGGERTPSGVTASFSDFFVFLIYNLRHGSLNARL
jgi:hypothetical protein